MIVIFHFLLDIPPRGWEKAKVFPPLDEEMVVIGSAGVPQGVEGG